MLFRKEKKYFMLLRFIIFFGILGFAFGYTIPLIIVAASHIDETNYMGAGMMVVMTSNTGPIGMKVGAAIGIFIWFLGKKNFINNGWLKIERVGLIIIGTTTLITAIFFDPYIKDFDDISQRFKERLNHNINDTSDIKKMHKDIHSLVVHSLTDDDIKKLLIFQELRFLTIQYSRDGKKQKITDEGLKYLSDLPNLVSLEIRGHNQITNDGLKYISSIKTLKWLKLLELDNITDEGLKYLPNSPNLASLFISGCNQITDDGLKHISNIKTLEKLWLWELDNITDEGIKYLPNLPNLASLYIDHCNQITDDGLKHISNIKTLEKLRLRELDNITDEGLRYISKLDKLETFDLHNCKNTTSNGIKQIKHILIKY